MRPVDKTSAASKGGARKSNVISITTAQSASMTDLVLNSSSDVPGANATDDYFVADGDGDDIEAASSSSSSRASELDGAAASSSFDSTSSSSSSFVSSSFASSSSGWDLAADRHQRERREAVSCAVRFLSRREYSAHELLQKLRAKKFPSDLVESVVVELQADGLQSDERFAEGFVRTRIGRGQGPLRIRQELRHRGVSNELVEALLDQPDSYWVQKAIDLLLKRQSTSAFEAIESAPGQLADDETDDENTVDGADAEARQANYLARRRRIAGHSRFLANRGFSGSVVSAALSAVSNT